MRRLLPIALSLLAVALAGCPKRPSGGKCSSNEDCAAQEGFGKICVQGMCQECGRDTDCPAGFSCRDNKCVPRAECDESRPCPAGQKCQAGKCAAAQAAPAPGPAQAATPEPVRCQLQRVSFDFNDAGLRGDARDTLAKNADCLKQMNARKVTIEGHCDERGTNEYNQHLGQRRAESVRRYLVNLGVQEGSLDVVSFGEEKPVCGESTETCWSQNRRAELRAQ
jgi:peptidoglycan-associated lipoprotein